MGYAESQIEERKSNAFFFSLSSIHVDIDGLTSGFNFERILQRWERRGNGIELFFLGGGGRGTERDRVRGPLGSLCEQYGIFPA